MGMFWQFERSVGARAWDRGCSGTRFGSKGEYQEVEYLEIRQMYDEYKHARMYEMRVAAWATWTRAGAVCASRGASSHRRRSGCTRSLQRLVPNSHAVRAAVQSSGQ